jgi:iron complex outermembrane recepter protein
MTTLHKALLPAVTGVAVSLLTGYAYGQAAPATPPTADTPESLETVVITGIRAAVRSAEEEKKNSDQMVDAIVAEDIGKLPDNNVIEALQHVTGVQIARNQAETNQLLIRGLPDVATTVNGRDIFTSIGRFVTLQDIPAELLSKVDVQKSSRADDIEGGIAGLIDIRLHRPFDFDGFEVAGTAMGTHSSLSTETDPRASLLLSNRWNTSAGEFGLLADVSYAKDRYKEEILDNYISTQSIMPVPGSTGAGGVGFIPLTEGAQSIVGNRERLSANVSAQFSPNANTEFFAEGFYTRYRNPNYNDFFVGLPWICGNPATATVFPGTAEVKTVTGGCYDLTSNQSFVPKTDTYQIATGMTWTGDNVKFTSELDYTWSHFTQEGVILDTHYGPPPDGYTADFNYKGTGTPYMNVTGIDLTDPSQFQIRQLYDQWQDQKGDAVNWRGDFNFKMGGDSLLKSVDTGVRLGDRFASQREDNQGGLDCGGVADPSSPQFADVAAAIASPACNMPLSALPGKAYHLTSGSQFNGDFGITHWTDADPNWLINNIAYLRELFDQSPTGARPPPDPTQSFDDREISYSGYVKANFGFDLGSRPVDGNIGLRLIDTHATMRGNSLVVSTPDAVHYTFTYQPTETDKNTLDWLPSLNARLKIQDDFFLRIAASRTVTRPTFLQLDPSVSLSASTATLLGAGTAGNPNLNPERSTNGDLSLEYYFGRQNSLTAAVFYRQIDDYIQNAITAQTIAGITYQVTQPLNAPPGHLDGVEMGYTQFFDQLPGLLNGLGVQANGTYVDGPFQNISKWSYNLVGIYDKGPAEIRVAYNWRSGFNVGATPGGVSPAAAEPGTIFAKAQPWLDLSASYRIWEKLTLTFDATNLLNSSYQDYFGNAVVFPRDTRRFDQTYSLGLRYRL